VRSRMNNPSDLSSRVFRSIPDRSGNTGKMLEEKT